MAKSKFSFFAIGTLIGIIVGGLSSHFINPNNREHFKKEIKKFKINLINILEETRENLPKDDAEWDKFLNDSIDLIESKFAKIINSKQGKKFEKELIELRLKLNDKINELRKESGYNFDEFKNQIEDKINKFIEKLDEENGKFIEEGSRNNI